MAGADIFDIDDDLRADIMISFENAFDEIESGLASLEEDFDSRVVASLFRAIHSIKGNSGMVNVDIIVNYTHEMENVFSRLRAGTMEFSRNLGEALAVGMDRLKDLHYQQYMKSNFENLDIEGLGNKFKALAHSTKDNENQCICDILGIPVEDSKTAAHEIVCISSNYDQESDLEYFRSLSAQLDTLNEYWTNRSQQTYTLALSLNKEAGSPVDSDQLAAATYIHDLGMSFIPSSIIFSEEKLSEDDIAQIRQHPKWGYEFLKRIPGWSEASEIVLHHHEHFDGNGYPDGQKGDQIHTGAKIMSIIDAFVSMTKGRADRTQRRTALRAVSEINARKGAQFDPQLVDAFNELLRREIREGRL